MEEQHRSSSSHGDDIEVLDSSDNKRDEAAARVQGAVIELENLLLPPIITTIQDLKDMPKIWYKIHVLIFDLRNYQANTKSRDRLKTVIDPSYIGLPYFSCTEAALMKSLQVGDTNGSATLVEVIEETLKERLERRTKKRAEGGERRLQSLRCSRYCADSGKTVWGKRERSDEG